MPARTFGRRLLPRLIAAGHEVVALARGPERAADLEAASATVAALERGAPELYNVVDDDPAPVSEWLPALADALGARPPRRVPAWLARLAIGDGGVMMMTAIRSGANAKAKRELGWSPRYASWREGFGGGLG